MSKLSLNKSTQLSEIEFILLTLIYQYLDKLDNLKRLVVESVQVNELTKTIDTAKQLSVLQQFELLTALKKQFFEAASRETLSKIINEEKFASQYSYVDPQLIDKRVLPSFSSYDKFPINNPKASIYKLLGATVIA